MPGGFVNRGAPARNPSLVPRAVPVLSAQSLTLLRLSLRAVSYLDSGLPLG